MIFVVTIIVIIVVIIVVVIVIAIILHGFMYVVLTEARVQNIAAAGGRAQVF